MIQEYPHEPTYILQIQSQQLCVYEVRVLLDKLESLFQRLFFVLNRQRLAALQLTDYLSVGIIFPYIYMRMCVHAYL